MTVALTQLQTWFSTKLPRRGEDRGASVVEYALLLALIFAVVIVAVNVIGETTSASLSRAGSSGFSGPN
jgi:Flp pilus assembly pilin Flp